MSHANLYNLIHDAKFTPGIYALTDAQQSDIVSMVGKGCRAETKQRLVRMVSLPLSLWTKHGIYSCVTLDDEGASYICGQSRLDEMRTLRECMLNK